MSPAEEGIAAARREDAERQAQSLPLRIFHGARGEHGASVVIEAQDGKLERPLPLRLDLRKHSPSGFEWGYAGSGPAQLALAMLAIAVGDERAQRCYQLFKAKHLAGLQANEWWMAEDSVRLAVEAIERDLPGSMR